MSTSKHRRSSGRHDQGPGQGQDRGQWRPGQGQREGERSGQGQREWSERNPFQSTFRGRGFESRYPGARDYEFEGSEYMGTEYEPPQYGQYGQYGPYGMGSWQEGGPQGRGWERGYGGESGGFGRESYGSSEARGRQEGRGYESGGQEPRGEYRQGFQGSRHSEHEEGTGYMGGQTQGWPESRGSRARTASRFGAQGGSRQESMTGTRGSFAGRGPQAYRRSDERILEDIYEALTQDDQVDATMITAEVKNGEAILKGTVPDRTSKRIAEEIAESCSGVKDVQNQLRIKREGEGETESRDREREDKRPGGKQSAA